MNNLFIYVLVNLIVINNMITFFWKQSTWPIQVRQVHKKQKSPFLGAHELILVKCVSWIFAISVNEFNKTFHPFRCAVKWPNLVLYTAHDWCYVLNFINLSLIISANSKIYSFPLHTAIHAHIKYANFFQSYLTRILFTNPPDHGDTNEIP